MKKLAIAAFASSILLSACSDNGGYASECRELINLTYEAAEVIPSMKASLGMDKDTMLKTSIDAWARMSEAERKAATDRCKVASAQMKGVIEAAKKQK